MRTKEQQLAYSRKYEATHKKERALKNQRWANKNHASLMVYKWKETLRKKYGITPEQYYVMFEAQNGNCAICGINQSQFVKKLYVDHSHKTGKVRGILCVNCNMLIGHAMEDPEILNKAIAYLKSYGIHGG